MRCIQGDCQNGQGTIIYPGGYKYTGEWKDGKKHGKGIEKISGGETKRGYWVNDKYVGQQKPVYSN